MAADFWAGCAFGAALGASAVPIARFAGGWIARRRIPPPPPVEEIRAEVLARYAKMKRVVAEAKAKRDGEGRCTGD